MKSSRHKTDRAAKIAWLREHPEIWQGNQLQLATLQEDHHRIAKAMKMAGLYSPSTYVKDIHVAELIEEARNTRGK